MSYTPDEMRFQAQLCRELAGAFRAAEALDYAAGRIEELEKQNADLNESERRLASAQLAVTAVEGKERTP